MCMHHRPDRTEGASAPTVTMPADDVRVSSAERDAVVDQLKRHAADGRLSLDEMSERMDEALGATRGDQLRHALRELPPLDAAKPHPHRGSHRHPGSRILLVAALLAVCAVASGHLWVLFPLGWFVLARGFQPWRFARARRHRYQH